MLLAQVIGLGLSLGGQWPQHNGGVRVDGSQGGHGRALAAGLAAVSDSSHARRLPCRCPAVIYKEPRLADVTDLFPFSPGRIPPRSAAASGRRPAGRRDRHGRGLRGPLLPPHLPAWRTRAERFDELVVDSAQSLARRWPSVNRIQFAVEEVPPSDPAPWERSVVLGRGFTAEPRAGLPARVVIYRRPVASRAADEADLVDLVHRVVVEQVALMLGRRPEEIDPDSEI